uniref:CSON014817 protein n=1 Tax=Culicoides sonorensis TaxID=179676 RepID=A0A336KRG3_CULSO
MRQIPDSEHTIIGNGPSTSISTFSSCTNKNNNINNNDKCNKWTKRRRSKITTASSTSPLLYPVLITNNNKHNNSLLVIINYLVYLIICVSLITQIPCSSALISDLESSNNNNDDGSSTSSSDSNNNSKNVGGSLFSMDDALNRFNMENQIAAIFSRVSYGSTTTKRSISDLGLGQSSLTTIPTPFLTTNRYREKEKEPTNSNNKNHELQKHYQQINSHHRNFEEILERDHGLPTSAPNADILKTNSNPMYPNPNRHHNHERHHGNGPTPSPGIPVHPGLGGNHNRVPTVPMLPGDMPSYSPPSRAFFTPPLPREYSNPFADKPTLRGTNNDPSVVNSNTFINRRIKPPPGNIPVVAPPSQRIPLRPPDLAPGAIPPAVGTSVSNNNKNNFLNNTLIGENDDAISRKKALNTPSQKLGNKDQNFGYGIDGDQNGMLNGTDPLASSRVVHIPSISRILSGSNGRKEDISDVILRTVTVIPNLAPALSGQQTPARDLFPVVTQNTVITGNNLNKLRGNRDPKVPGEEYPEGNNANNANNDDVVEEEDEDDIYDKESDEQIVGNNESGSTELPYRAPNKDDNEKEIVHDLAKSNHDRSLYTTTANPHEKHNSIKDRAKMSGFATWTVAWNVHVYLSAILFTILAVYSIFKMIFFDKLTHLFNQSYFICIHLILIIICLARIFYLCYDAYNAHRSFNIFVSEILLNLPATFLTVAFAILILFLLIRSTNHKNNRYSALMRPLTVVIASSVHVGLCITLHYVESYETMNNYYHPNVGAATLNGAGSSTNGGNKYLVKGPNGIMSPPPILSLICQIIYIFVCLSLGFLYLYIYRMLKRILRNKSQNYIHGYQNLSYAIHITVATALLFILLAALQIYGAIGLSMNKPIMSSPLDTDWLQWGYQFSLRLIEIAIITLLSWVTGLKTGASKVLQREKRLDTHNVSGFALFPCTSSSSQEHFETDYPAVCNANTNLHSYTLRTGKPIYDDNFALNSMAMDPNAPQGMMIPMPGDNGPPYPYPGQSIQDFQQLPPNHPDHPSRASNRAAQGTDLDTNSIVSSMHNSDKMLSVQEIENSVDYMQENSNGPIDHYENPNFELRGSGPGMPQQIPGDNSSQSSDRTSTNRLMLDNGYAEPINSAPIDPRTGQPMHQFDFQNFERPSFDRPSSRNEFRASKNLKALKQQQGVNGPYPTHDHNNYGFGNGPAPRGYNTNYNSFDRRNRDAQSSGIKKSGTLSNIGNGREHRGRFDGSNSSGDGQMVDPRDNRRTTQTLNNSGRQKHARMNGNGSNNEWRTSSSSSNNRSSLERGTNKNYNLSDDDYNNGRKDSLLDPSQASTATPGSSSGESASSGSMLVAEHGFVRFKALDELGQPQQQQQPQQKFTRSSGRTSNKERKLTNS